ncbi:MAG: PAS domain-containing protein [Chloroflexi bacterium]|nr:PAS domain-containing protein [Chloroflexota bacterium]
MGVDFGGSTFVSPQTLSQLGSLTREGADALGHGAIKLDDDGVILLYNRYESHLSGIDPSVAEGKRFFTQLAPCTNNRLFYGKFQEGIEDDELDIEFNYTFTYRMRPTLVRVMLRRDPGSSTTWVFVKRR